MKFVSSIGISVAVFAFLGCTTPDHGSVASQPTPYENDGVARTPAADADLQYITERDARPAVLEKCGGKDGYAKLVRNRITGKLQLEIRNIECGYYKTDYGGVEKLELDRSNNSHGIELDVRENDPGYHQVIVGSKPYFEKPEPGSRGDIIRFYVPPQTLVFDLYTDRVTKPVPLPMCDGTVQATIKNGIVNVVFRAVENCTMFDIVSNSGASLSYDAKPLQAQGQAMGGGFSIPPKFVEFGSNGVVVKVYRNTGTGDKILLRFMGGSPR